MGDPSYQVTDRRPLTSRQKPFFVWFAALLARRGASPNAISILSILFAALGSAALIATSQTTGWTQRLCWLGGAAGVQLRLVMNLLDGMVAVNSGKASPIGELFNEIPDRISDPLIFIATGYAAGGDPTLGFLAAIASLFVAYIRAVGKTIGAGQVYLGPMAKQQRMFLITVMCIYGAATPPSLQQVVNPPGWGPAAWVLALIIAGCAATSARRLLKIASILRETRPV